MTGCLEGFWRERRTQSFKGTKENETGELHGSRNLDTILLDLIDLYAREGMFARYDRQVRTGRTDDRIA